MSESYMAKERVIILKYFMRRAVMMEAYLLWGNMEIISLTAFALLTLV